MAQLQDPHALRGVQQTPLPVHRQKNISLVAGSGFYIVVLAMLTFISSVGYRNEINSAKDSVRFQSMLFSDETRIAFDRIDKLLDILEVSLFTGGQSVMTTPLMSLVRNRVEELGFIRSIVLLAPNGQVLLHLGQSDPVDVELYQNIPHYSIDLQVSAPSRTHRDGLADYFSLYRPVLNPQGEIINYVVATVDLLGFVNEMGIADIDPSMRLSLFRNDGVLFARSSDTILHSGKAFPQFAKTFGNARNGEGMGRSPLDNKDYIYAFARVEGFSLTAIASRQYDSVLQPWKMELLVIGLIAVLVFVANVMVLGLLSRNRKVIEETQKKLLEQAYTDQLTGLLNRRAFFVEAEKRVAEARRYNRDLSLLVLDIDHFKVVNDTYGHDAGDQALKDVARIMSASSREADVLSRYGGEEFTLLLPQTDLEGAVTTAEKLRQVISSSEIVFADSRFHLTISVGAVMLRPEDTVQTLFQRGDSLLYLAKRSGRNRVEQEQA